MPSKSPAQARFMRAVAHSPEFAQKVHVPVSVGREFANADKMAEYAKRDKAHTDAYIKALRTKR